MAPKGRDARWVLGAAEVQQWLQRPVVVEEKLDGANVSIWLDGEALRVAPRGGADAQDRAGQLGRLRAWAAEHDAALRTLLADGRALYGEWLWLRHGVAYDRLPDLLVVLDLWHEATDFLPLYERDDLVANAGLLLPPRLFEGVPGSMQRLEALFGSARWSSEAAAEGLVLRAAHGGRCKLVAPQYRRPTDEQWLTGRPTNQLQADPSSVAAR